MPRTPSEMPRIRQEFEDVKRILALPRPHGPGRERPHFEGVGAALAWMLGVQDVEHQLRVNQPTPGRYWWIDLARFPLAIEITQDPWAELHSPWPNGRPEQLLLAGWRVMYLKVYEPRHLSGQTNPWMEKAADFVAVQAMACDEGWYVPQVCAAKQIHGMHWRISVASLDKQRQLDVFDMQNEPYPHDWKWARLDE